MRFAIRSCGQLLVALLGLAACALPAAAAGPVLSGHWVLVDDESDDPRDALKGLTLMRQDTFLDDDRRKRTMTDQVSSNYYAQRALVEKRRSENAVADVGPSSACSMRACSISRTPAPPRPSATTRPIPAR